MVETVRETEQERVKRVHEELRRDKAWNDQLLTELFRAETRLGQMAQKWGTGNEAKVCKYAFNRIQALSEERQRRLSPRQCYRRIATEPTKDVNGGIFGKGTTLWFCPECGVFNTPVHKFCWKCGQALAFDLPKAEKKEEKEPFVRSKACQRCKENEKCLWDLDAVCHCCKPKDDEQTDSLRAEGDVQSENE